MKWRFSLRWLMLFVVPVCSFGAFWIAELHTRQQLLDEVRADDVEVVFFPTSGIVGTLPDMLVPDCLRRVQSFDGDLSSPDDILRHFPSVEHVALVRATDSIIHDMQTCRKLKWLNLGDASAVSEVAFADLAKHIQLERLDIYEAAHLAPSIAEHRSLRRVTCPNASAGQVISVSRLKQLEILFLSGVDLSQEEVLSKLGALTEMRQLSILNTDLSGQEFGFVKHLRKLELLDLSYCVGVSDIVLENASMLRLKHLRLGVYDGTQNEVTDAGLEYLKNSFLSLEELDIFGTRVSDDSLSTLAKMHSLKTLTVGDDLGEVESVLPTTQVKKVSAWYSVRRD